MSEIKMSSQLSNKLGDERVGEIKELSTLIDFKPILVEMMEANNCSDVVRESVLQKMESLTEVLVKISSITQMHISNDAKRSKIEKELDGFELKAFKTALYSEISATDKTLKSKVTEIGRNITNTAKEKANSLKKMFEDNMKLVSESLNSAKKKEAELKRQDGKDEGAKNVEVEVQEVDKSDEEPTLESLENKKADLLKAREEVTDKKHDAEREYEKVVDEKQLTVANYKALGFVETFKKMWKQRNSNPDKKQGFFSIVRDAYRESVFSKGEAEKSGVNDKISDLYAQQLEVDAQIKKYEREYKELSRQLKDVNKEISIAAQACMQDCRSAFDSAVEPISKKDITPSRLTELTSKIEKFGASLGDKSKDWKQKIDIAISTVLAYTVDPILDTVLGTADKTNELEESAKNAKEKAEEARSQAELASQQKAIRDAEYSNSQARVENLTKESYIEEKIGSRVIKGVNKIQSKMADRRYDKAQKKLEMAENKSQKAEEKVTQYRSARNSEGMDR